MIESYLWSGARLSRSLGGGLLASLLLFLSSVPVDWDRFDLRFVVKALELEPCRPFEPLHLSESHLELLVLFCVDGSRIHDVQHDVLSHSAVGLEEAETLGGNGVDSFGVALCSRQWQENHVLRRPKVGAPTPGKEYHYRDLGVEAWLDEDSH